jgi:hypothetical protein
MKSVVSFTMKPLYPREKSQIQSGAGSTRPIAGLDAVAKGRILSRMGTKCKSFGHIMLHVLLGGRGEGGIFCDAVGI